MVEASAASPRGTHGTATDDAAYRERDAAAAMRGGDPEWVTPVIPRW
ncbi:hypothetical protein [Streptomyces sp. CB00316]|nr:hypothetical protein [Streptomyces sp. CB00316]